MTMKIKKTIQWLLLLCVFSCQNEPIGLPSEIENPKGVPVELPSESENSNEETDFYTGMDCVGSGEYSFDPDNLLTDIVIPDNLPESYDLSYLLPPIGNQGQQGSCVSWAVSYYLKSLQEKLQTGLPYTPETIMSPSYTYNQITHGNCSATSISQTLDIIKEKGVCSISVFPYSESSCSLQPTESNNQSAEKAKISHYKNLSGKNMVLEMKTLINEQTPIIIGTYLSSEFGKVDNFGLVSYREHHVDYNLDRCHAMLVIGYSDTYNAFKVVNSWGSSWGNDGYIWIDYKAFENVLDKNAEFRIINQAYVAYDL